MFVKGRRLLILALVLYRCTADQAAQLLPGVGTPRSDPKTSLNTQKFTQPED